MMMMKIEMLMMILNTMTMQDWREGREWGGNPPEGMSTTTLVTVCVLRSSHNISFHFIEYRLIAAYDIGHHHSHHQLPHHQWRPSYWSAHWCCSAWSPSQQLEGKGTKTGEAQWGQGLASDYDHRDYNECPAAAPEYDDDEKEEEEEEDGVDGYDDKGKQTGKA